MFEGKTCIYTNVLPVYILATARRLFQVQHRSTFKTTLKHLEIQFKPCSDCCAQYRYIFLWVAL